MFGDQFFGRCCSYHLPPPWPNGQVFSWKARCSTGPRRWPPANAAFFMGGGTSFCDVRDRWIFREKCHAMLHFLGDLLFGDLVKVGPLEDMKQEDENGGAGNPLGENAVFEDMKQEDEMTIKKLLEVELMLGFERCYSSICLRWLFAERNHRKSPLNSPPFEIECWELFPSIVNK